MHPDTQAIMPEMSKSEGREAVGAGGGAGEPCSHQPPGSTRGHPGHTQTGENGRWIGKPTAALIIATQQKAAH